MIQIRSIEEAERLQVPPTPAETLRVVDDAVSFARTANASRMAKLRRLYAAADLIVSEVAPMAVCHAGCAHCCRIDVDVRQVEAEYIEKNAAHRADSGTSHSRGHTAARRACTFLDDRNRCSIYDVRPFACRVFLTFDNPAYCEDAEIQHVVYGEQNHAALRKLGHAIAALDGHGRYRDIRDFFKRTA